MNLHNFNTNKGFTLIELMIVVAIIGILAAISIPQFISYRQRGHQANVVSQGKNVFVAAALAFSAEADRTIASTADLVPFGFFEGPDMITTASGTLSTLVITVTHNLGAQAIYQANGTYTVTTP